MRKYKVKVWCRDCCDVDTLGCFGGGTKYITDNYLNDKIFNTKKSAEKSGEDFCKNSVWEYELEEFTHP